MPSLPVNHSGSGARSSMCVVDFFRVFWCLLGGSGVSATGAVCTSSDNAIQLIGISDVERDAAAALIFKPN